MKRYERIILIMALISIILGCSNKKFKENSINSTEFFIKEINLSYYISENFNPLFLKIFFDSKSDKEYIVYYNEEVSAIKFYELNDTLVRNEFIIEKNRKLLDYFVITLDSVCVLSKNNHVSIYSAFKKYHYAIEDSIPVFHNKYSLSAFYEYPLSISNNELLIYNFPKHPLNSEEKLVEYFKSQRDIHLKLVNDKLVVVGLSGIYPKSFYENNFYIYSPIRTIGKNNLIYSFPCSEEIFTYDTNKREYETIKLQASNFDKNEYFIKDKVFDYNYIGKYLTENDRFGVMVYSSTQKKYFRILTHGIAFENMDGTINKFIDKPFSILIYGDEFSFEQEITFPAKEYDLRTIYLTKDNFLIPKKNENKLYTLAAFKFN